MEYTKEYESPMLYHQWVGLITMAASLRNRVYLTRGAAIHPNLYVVLVAGTATVRKSTAIKQGTDLSKQVPAVRHYRGTITGPSLIQSMRSDVPTSSDKRVAKKPAQEGTTINLNSVAGKREDSLFLVNDEMSTFMNEATRDSLESNLTQLWTCQPDWEYKTKTRGSAFLENTCLNMLLGTNPRWLSKSIGEDSFDGGFAGRVIWLFQSEPRQRNGWIKHGPERKDLEARLVEDLVHMSEHIAGEMGIEDSIREEFKLWDETRSRDVATSRMVGYNERKPETALKLAILLSISESDERIVRERHVRAAWDMLKTMEAYMPFAFRYIGTEDAAIGEEILNLLQEHHGEMLQRDLLKKVKNRLRNGKKQFEAILDLLDFIGDVSYSSSGTDPHAIICLGKKQTEQANQTTDLTQSLMYRAGAAGVSVVDENDAEIIGD